MNTIDMPAGPELDLAVAKACGFIHCPDSEIAVAHGHRYVWFRTRGCMSGRAGDGGPRGWNPSTEIAQAFEALEEMPWVRCLIVRTDRGYGFTTWEDGQYLPWAGEAATIPLAICRAIVAAGKGGGT